MGSGFHKRARELFCATLKLPEADRSRFLEDQCPDDTTLRVEIESLLQHHSTEDLTRAAVDPNTFRSLFNHPETIGPYTIVDLLGHGGMGVVYAARQEEPVRRQVAIKLLRGGLSRDAGLRFEMEQQALAMMDHPSIAHVYDGGTTSDGRPYFVMENVGGIPITEHCDRHQLSVPERLELFARICDGVQHAHQKGIIHRDLKPSNILVSIQDDVVSPKIIDFGIAKFMGPWSGDTPHTRHDQTLGTLEYMSPEQLVKTAQDVDTRTDVYALGVVLYELLTGRTALNLRELGPTEQRHRILQEEPVAPSAILGTTAPDPTIIAEARSTTTEHLAKRLRDDLDIITLKTLEKDRTRRYTSAAELGMDIRRHLQDKPILAAPPSATYQVRKFILRHRLAVLGVAVIAVGLLVGLGGTLFGLRRATLSLERVKEAEARAAQFADFNEKILTAIDPETAEGMDTQLLQVLLRSQAYQAETSFDDPVDQARVLCATGRTFQSIDAFEDAETHLKACIELRARGLGDDHSETLDARDWIGRLYMIKGDLPRAEEILSDVLERRLNALSQNDPDLGNSYLHLGEVAVKNADFDQAERLFDKALQIFERTLGPRNEQVATVLKNYDNVLTRDTTEHDRLERYLNRSLSIRREIFGNDSLQVATVLSSQAKLLQARFDLTATPSFLNRAIALERESLTIRHKLLPEVHVRVALGNYFLGRRLMASGSHVEAKPYVETARSIFESLFGAEASQVAFCDWRLGQIHLALRDEESAVRLLSQAIDRLERNGDPDYEGHVQILETLATTLSALGRNSEAAHAAARAKKKRAQMNKG